MATVTKPYRPLTPRATPAEPHTGAEPEALDPLRPHLGDRIAFAVWIICVMFMAALLTYDTVSGLLR